MLPGILSPVLPIQAQNKVSIYAVRDKTWPGFSHTFTYQEDGAFAEGAGFNSVMLAYSTEVLDDFTKTELENNQAVSIYSLIPLYKEEPEFKNQNGAISLLELLDQYDVTEIVKIGRKNVCT